WPRRDGIPRGPVASAAARMIGHAPAATRLIGRVPATMPASDRPRPSGVPGV
ncbi:MAG: hypothetical protein AVDCRST_MAG19-2539, partial [uncultured Thermomicrobiales bacterium]